MAADEVSGRAKEVKSSKASTMSTAPSHEKVNEDSERNSNGVLGQEASGELPRDPNIVNWDGPNDPMNPLNWSSSTKVVAIAIVSLITFLSPLASTIIAPGTDLVMKEFAATSSVVAAMVTSVYILGYTFGPLMIAPLSELYGRAILYNVCNLVFLVFNIGCAKANSLAALIILRLFTGIAAACPVTLGAGSIADMIPHEKRGAAMAAWVIGPLLGPAIGPIVGAYVSGSIGWRWNFWIVSIVAGASGVMILLGLRESHAPTILEGKTRKLQKKTGNASLRSALNSGKTPGEAFRFSIFRPVKMLFFSPIVFVLSLYMAILYGYIYLCITTFPRVFEQQYGFSRGGGGLANLGIGIGSLLGLFVLGAVSDRQVKALTARHGGDPKPEYRLPATIIGALFVPAGLFWYGWTAEHKAHWILPIIGTGFLGGGMVIAFMAISTYLVDTFTVYAASAMAAATVCRSLLGALLPLAGNDMYDELGLGWGTSVLGFISVAFIPVPFFLYRYGERIRESKIFKVTF